MLVLLSMPVQAQEWTVEDKEWEEGDDYIAYPQIKGHGSQELENKINALLKEEALAFRYNTLQDIERFWADDAHIPPISFYGTYQITLLEENIFSVVFHQSHYMQSSAHPSNWITAITLDLHEGRALSLKDLFAHEGYLQHMNEYFQADVIRRDIPLLVELEELTPEQGYYLTGTALILYFPPYYYTPHAYGNLLSRIPYEELSSFICPSLAWLEDLSDLAMKPQEVIDRLIQAHEAYSTLARGGERPEHQAFTLNDIPYRYMSSELDSREKIEEFLSPIFTPAAIELGLEGMNIIQHEGRMAQPDADGGSLLEWENARVYLLDQAWDLLCYEVLVPYGRQYEEIFRITLHRTSEGDWRIHQPMYIFQ